MRPPIECPTKIIRIFFVDVSVKLFMYPSIYLAAFAPIYSKLRSMCCEKDLRTRNLLLVNIFFIEIFNLYIFAPEAL